MQRRVGVDPAEQQLRGVDPHIVGRLNDHGQERIEARQVGQFIETNQRDILRDRLAVVLQRFEHAHRDDIVRGDNRRLG